jgi:hypothetical protein
VAGEAGRGSEVAAKAGTNTSGAGQAALTSLIMRLILDHADKIWVGLLTGGGDDL